VEILTANLPEGARVELVLDKRLENRLIVETEGLERIADPLLSSKPMGKEYLEELERSLPEVRYGVIGERAVLRGIRSPRGEPIPARLVIEVPDDAPMGEERHVVVNTIDGRGAVVGGLTLNLIRGSHHQKNGPYPPR
jgi:hypothetical protein